VNSEIKKTRLGFDLHTEIKYIMNIKMRVKTVHTICIIKPLDYAMIGKPTSLSLDCNWLDYPVLVYFYTNSVLVLIIVFYIESVIYAVDRGLDLR